MKIYSVIFLLALNGCISISGDSQPASTQEHVDIIEVYQRQIEELREQIDDQKKINTETRNAGRRIERERFLQWETKADIARRKVYPNEDRLSDLRILEAILKREIASLLAEHNVLQKHLFTDTFDEFSATQKDQ
jgi:hypothetical protein